MAVQHLSAPHTESGADAAHGVGERRPRAAQRGRRPRRELTRAAWVVAAAPLGRQTRRRPIHHDQQQRKQSARHSSIAGAAAPLGRVAGVAARAGESGRRTQRRAALGARDGVARRTANKPPQAAPRRR